MSRSKRARQRGQSIVETCLLLPWLIFLFVGALDWGFYMHALISVQGAARVAAQYTSLSAGTPGNPGTAGDSAGACGYALQALTNVAVSGTIDPSCSSGPIQVTAQPGNDPVLGPYSSVTVTFQTIPLIPIPGILTGQLTVRETVVMRVKS